MSLYAKMYAGFILSQSVRNIRILRLFVFHFSVKNLNLFLFWIKSTLNFSWIVSFALSLYWDAVFHQFKNRTCLPLKIEKNSLVAVVLGQWCWRRALALSLFVTKFFACFVEIPRLRWLLLAGLVACLARCFLFYFPALQHWWHHTTVDTVGRVPTCARKKTSLENKSCLIYCSAF